MKSIVYLTAVGLKRVYAQVVSLIAGYGSSGYLDSSVSTSAKFARPISITQDSNGNIFVSDCDNNRIRKISPNGVVSTFAGSGSKGGSNAYGTSASFYYPKGIAIDSADVLYIADSFNNKIRKISTSGLVSTLAGSGSIGSYNGQGITATFYNPNALVVDSVGNVYVSDTSNHKIRKVDKSGIVSNFAGSGTNGYYDGSSSFAQFKEPQGIAIDSAGILYVADVGNCVIRKISKTGTVSTLTGGGTCYYNYDYKTLSFAYFYNPMGLAINSAGEIFVADQYRIKKINVAQDVVSPYGESFSGVTGIFINKDDDMFVSDIVLDSIYSVDGSVVDSTHTTSSTSSEPTVYTYSSSLLYSPSGVAFDSNGDIYASDVSSHKIFKISAATGVMTSIAGSSSYGSTNGYRSASSFNYPRGIAVYKGVVYVADEGNHRIRKIDTDGNVTSFAGYLVASAGYVVASFADGIGSLAYFKEPSGVAVDKTGTFLYVADTGNKRIRKIETSTATVTTLAGSGSSSSIDGIGSLASFYSPTGIAVDGAGVVYVTDYQLVRQISPTGNVSTIAGSIYFSGSVNGFGTAARFWNPWGIAVDSFGNLFVADSSNNQIRKISISGNVSTYAGSSSCGSTDGAGTSLASFCNPIGVAVDYLGNLLVAERSNSAIRYVKAAGSSSISNPVGFTATINSNKALSGTRADAAAVTLGFYLFILNSCAIAYFFLKQRTLQALIANKVLSNPLFQRQLLNPHTLHVLQKPLFIETCMYLCTRCYYMMIALSLSLLFSFLAWVLGSTGSWTGLLFFILGLIISFCLAAYWKFSVLVGEVYAANEGVKDIQLKRNAKPVNASIVERPIPVPMVQAVFQQPPAPPMTYNSYGPTAYPAPYPGLATNPPYPTAYPAPYPTAYPAPYPTAYPAPYPGPATNPPYPINPPQLPTRTVVNWPEEYNYNPSAPDADSTAPGYEYQLADPLSNTPNEEPREIPVQAAEPGLSEKPVIAEVAVSIESQASYSHQDFQSPSDI